MLLYARTATLTPLRQLGQAEYGRWHVSATAYINMSAFFKKKLMLTCAYIHTHIYKHIYTYIYLNIFTPAALHLHTLIWIHLVVVLKKVLCTCICAPAPNTCVDKMYTYLQIMSTCTCTQAGVCQEGIVVMMLQL